MNIDGCMKGPSGSIGAGGLLRDNNGNWISGFTANLWKGKIIAAELWGLFFGLRLAWMRGFRSVEVEVDSATVVTLVNQQDNSLHPLHTLIRGCQAYLKMDWHCKLSHIYREKNFSADYLASIGLTYDLGYFESQSPPPGCIPFLFEDSLGYARPREVIR